MAAAVSSGDVKDIIETSIDTDRIDAMIEAAETVIVDRLDPLGTTIVTAAIRRMIKIYLSAHYVAIYQGETIEESAGGSRIKLGKNLGQGLSATSWGQQAIALDPSGELAKMSDQRKRRLRYRINDDSDDSIKGS